MIRIGAADRTVHPYYTRRMFRLLRQQQTNVTYSELADKEHWWWDTYKTNDGGVVNDPVIRNFAISHAKNAGKPSTPASKAFRVRALAGDTALCSWARHFTLTVPLSTQVYKWVPANLMLGVTLQWTSILSRGKLG